MSAILDIPPEKLTPMFRQYREIKQEHPDSLLFYRMGDFYELFFDDAQTAARELKIALTCRNPNPDLKAPMCGVPHHAAPRYIRKLLEKGLTVVVCDQVEDPREAKGLVKREVTQVLTPGTVVEEESLEEKGQNYLAALVFDDDKGRGGLAFADISTGEFSGLYSTSLEELTSWVRKLGIRELLLPEGDEHLRGGHLDGGPKLTFQPRARFSKAKAAERLLASQGLSESADLAALDLADKPELTAACGALLAYAEATQRRERTPLTAFKVLSLARHLIIDDVTERNLEIFRRLDGGKGAGTLIQAIDRTQTPMGGRLLAERLRHPWRDKGPIERTQEMVAYFHGADTLRAALREGLAAVYDVERLATRIFLDRASPKDFVALRASLALLPRLKELLDATDEAARPATLFTLLSSWDDLADVHELLARALVDAPPPTIADGGLFLQGYDPALDELLELTEHGTAKLDELLEAEKAKAELPKLKLKYNRVFGYFFELPKVQALNAPEHFIRRQTLTNAERFTTEALKELEGKLLSASEKRKDMERTLFAQLRATVAEARERFLYMADTLAGLDYWQGLAEAARSCDWTRPTLHTSTRLHISAGRHPVVEAIQGAASFIPNDLDLGGEKKILLITGPNMAGKSTVLRQAAIILILAQIGSFVPARAAEIGLADRVFSRVGASDNLAMGQSTFMVEMTETARILRQAGRKSFVILDEIGRGTSTFDGLALAWSVVEELARRGNGGIRTLFATHYHELTALEGVVPGVRNLNIAVAEHAGEIIFLRRLVPGPSDRSYGIEVAKLAGVPRPVVARAKEVLATLEAKAANEADRATVLREAHTLLPGVAAEGTLARPKEKPKPHPLIAELANVEVDRLTPVEALTLLNDWKTKWGKDG